MRGEAGDVVRGVACALEGREVGVEVLALAPARARVRGAVKTSTAPAAWCRRASSTCARIARRMSTSSSKSQRTTGAAEVVEHDLAGTVVARDGDERGESSEQPSSARLCWAPDSHGNAGEMNAGNMPAASIRKPQPSSISKK